MIYHIQGNYTQKILEVEEALRKKLNIGPLRIIRESDFNNSSIQGIMATAEFMDKKTSDVIVITESVHLINQPRYKSIDISHLPFMVESIPEKSLNEIIEYFTDEKDNN